LAVRRAHAAKAAEFVRIGFLGPSLNTPSTAANYKVFLFSHRVERGWDDDRDCACSFLCS
jgi:hypothetical protein